MNSMPTATSPNSGTPTSEARMTMQPPQADAQIEDALIGKRGHFDDHMLPELA
jgi:hypothetical protein